MIALIDYGSGNLRSVRRALEKIGANVELFASPDGLDRAEAVVLPGVGAFGACVEQLHAQGLWRLLSEWLAAGKPFLGVCLGYQMLFEHSEESPGIAGFGYFKGHVKRFAPDTGLKVPHMGWNGLHLTQSHAPLWQGIPEGAAVYFVHSYFPAPADPSIIAATADYGGPFAAALSSGPISGVQFHPEKSQDIGLQILRNFVASL